MGTMDQSRHETGYRMEFWVVWGHILVSKYDFLNFTQPFIHPDSPTQQLFLYEYFCCVHISTDVYFKKKKPHQSFTCKYPHRHSVFADCRAVLFSGSNVCSNNMLRLIIQDRIVPKCKKRCRWRELQSKSSLTCPATQIKWNFKNVDFKTWYQQQ